MKYELGSMNITQKISTRVPISGYLLFTRLFGGSPKRRLLLATFCVLPSLVSAQQKIEIFTNPNRGLSFSGLANKIQVIANAVIPFLVGLAVVGIIWGIFKYVKSAGDAEKIVEGRKTIVYGIVALFIMVAFWGLVLAIKKSLFG